MQLAGSAEHTLVDDLAPWVALLPEEAVLFLRLNTSLLITVGAIAGVIGAPLAILIFYQTYLFEGKHTENTYLRLTASWNLPKQQRFQNA